MKMNEITNKTELVNKNDRVYEGSIVGEILYIEKVDEKTTSVKIKSGDLEELVNLHCTISEQAKGSKAIYKEKQTDTHRYGQLYFDRQGWLTLPMFTDTDIEQKLEILSGEIQGETYCGTYRIENNKPRVD